MEMALTRCYSTGKILQISTLTATESSHRLN